MSATRYAAGKAREGDYRCGDLLLTHRTQWVNKLISFGQRLRYSREYAYYTHAVLVLDKEGNTAEAIASGVARGHVSDYNDTEYHYIDAVVDDHDASQVRAFAEDVLTSRWQYGYLTIVCVILSLLTGSKLVFGLASSAICSGFCADALTRGGYIFETPPAFMTPAGLAKEFDIKR